MAETKTKRIKLASASLSQIVYDYAHNFRNFQTAIDMAVEDRADILATQELSGTGYEADDYHQWNKNNDDVWVFLQAVANYAAAKDPNLTVTVGVPWHHADKDKNAKDPEYNINNRPHNTDFLIRGGKVIGVYTKSILADGPAEYEPRQFNKFEDTIYITLPDGSKVPYGKPVIHLGDGTDFISLFVEICAEGWPGVHDDLSINAREQNEARHIVALAKTHDLSIVLNPSASKPQPAINKERIRSEGLCKTGSEHCGVFLYTNYLGSAAGTLAAEGSQIFAQNGEIIQHGQRYTFKDVGYSSIVVDVPVATRGTPSATVEHEFRAHELGAKTGGEAAFDTAYAAGTINSEQLAYEEYLRSISLWLRDYMSKPHYNPQGYVIPLSGGQDSAYGAIAVANFIESDVRENGVEAFMQRFHNLKCHDEILKINAEQGAEAALDAIKKNLLICINLPTENSSARTLNAARFLIEGGTLPDGTYVKGIGGTFFVAPVQAALDEITIGAMGLDLTKIAREHAAEILGRKHFLLPTRIKYLLARDELTKKIKNYINAAPGSNPTLPAYVTDNCAIPLPTWADKKYDLTLQNLQARARLPFPWTVAGHPGQNKIPLVTSNESEAVHSYTTAGGDMHMGGANPIGGIPKHAITQSLDYLEKHGLVGLQPIHSLYWINRETPSAELRQIVEGQAEQTDEDDLGFSYAQSQFIEEQLLVGRQTPYDVLPLMTNDNLFPKDLAAKRDILIGFTKRWEAGHFKRIMGTLAPHVGGNVDPHQAVRTTVLGDHFRTGCAYMALDVLKQLAGGEQGFVRKFAMTSHQARTAAMLNAPFKSALISWSIDQLKDPNSWQEFDADNRMLVSYASQPVNQNQRSTYDAHVLRQ